MLIRSVRLEVEILPEVGGKIAQIRDLRTGRTLLVPPQCPYRTIPPGNKWVEFDTSGMDDCFPNVDECSYPRAPWAGRRLPQLGEWVYGSWDLVTAASDSVTLERIGTDFPYTARKTVSLNGEAKIELHYRVENRGDAPMQYMWSAHPLFQAGPDFQLCVPTGRLSFTTFPPDGRTYEWPYYGSIDLSQQWIPGGSTLKVFITGFRDGVCSLVFPGYTIRFEFDPSRNSVIGVWFNNFGFPRHSRPPVRCIAVEPCTSPSDVLDLSASPVDPVLGPKSCVEWRLSIALD